VHIDVAVHSLAMMVAVLVLGIAALVVVHRIRQQSSTGKKE
jgi:type II secretory pathway pseudopilin PulG